MRKLTQYLLWAFVFMVPWDVVPLPLVGTASRAIGLAVAAAAVLTTAIEGRFRKPDAVLGFAIAFGVWSALSLLWTLSYGNTLPAVITYVQLVASVWVIREVVRTREQIEPLLAALCFGLFVPLTGLMNNYRLGIETHRDTSRYSGVGFNANALAFLLVLGLPIAWHLFMHRRDIVRLAGLLYVLTAPVGLLLTATRGALVAGIAASAIVPLTLPRQSLRSYALVGVLLILVTLAAVQLVPQSNWKRVLSTSSEIAEGGSLSGRAQLWNAGLQAFPQRPLLGAGLNAYAEALAIQGNLRYRGAGAHNVAIGLLVEEGIVGLALFAAIFGACAWTIFHSPPPNRALWGVLILTWLVLGMSGSPESMKFTWVLFGLVSAQSGLSRPVTNASPTEQPSYTARESMSTAPI
jgi:O-antigen ligase